MAPMLATRAPVGLSYPPATSTFPLGSNVAVKLIKGVSRPAATVQTWLTGSYSSALSRILPPVQPPRTRTLPSANRSEEHRSELQSLMRISYAVFCLKKKKPNITKHDHTQTIITNNTTV